MGNYTSSCLLGLSHPRPKAAKLIDSQGNIRQVVLPSKAGEIMLEEPGHAISPVHELQKTGRVVAMRAEDELVAGKLYLLVSLSRVNHKASAKEMGIVDTTNKKRLRKRRRGGARVLPDVGGQFSEEGKENEVNVLGDGDHKGSFSSSSSGLRKGNHGPWIPALEPILEEL